MELGYLVHQMSKFQWNHFQDSAKLSKELTSWKTRKEGKDFSAKSRLKLFGRFVKLSIWCRISVESDYFQRIDSKRSLGAEENLLFIAKAYRPLNLTKETFNFTNNKIAKDMVG